VGVALTWKSASFGWDGAAIFGDSGSPVRVTDLKAVGDLTHRRRHEVAAELHRRHANRQNPPDRERVGAREQPAVRLGRTWRNIS
jgi:hypothetical protein